MARVLIIDDSPTESRRIAQWLAHHGHDVFSAENGNDGVAMARTRMPDVVLMDVVMPGMNGFQATREITRDEVTRHIPVIIVSSKRERADEVWGRRQGACGYLIKPVTEQLLIDEVQRVLCAALPG
jgi:twitching motility two-component system response regulator PilH